MKDDYLWDKTGKDADIEKLENALRVFRVTTDIPPAIPFTIAGQKPARKKFFSLSYVYAYAAVTAIALILLGAWIQVSDREISIENDLAETITPKVETIIPSGTTVKKEAASVVRSMEIPPIRTAANGNRIISQSNFRSRIRNPKSKIQNPKSEIVLTSEEKYAYGQLMLALSITSSKLRIVRDKASGIENREIIVIREDKTGRN